MLKGLSAKELARVDDLVDNHDYSIADAVELVKSDREIDQGKRMDFDLSVEDEKMAKKYANSTEKTAKKPKTRKEDAVKRAFIAETAQFLNENWANTIENVEILNPERIISFEFDGEKYEFLLQKKRKERI